MAVRLRSLPSPDLRSVAVALVLLAGAAIALVVLVDLVQAAVQIHQYQDMDNEAGLGAWHYRFGTLRLVAIVLALALGGSLLAARRSRQPRRLLWYGGLGLVLALGGYIVIAARHSEQIANDGGDPWWSMRACAVALSVEVAAATAMCVRVLRRSAS